MPAALARYWAAKRRSRRTRKAQAPVASTPPRRRAARRRGSSRRSFGARKRYASRRGFAFMPAGTLPLVGGAVVGAAGSDIAGSMLPATSGIWTRRGVQLAVGVAGHQVTKRFSPGFGRGILIGALANLALEAFAPAIAQAGAAVKKAAGMKGYDDGPPQIGAADYDIERGGVGDANYNTRELASSN